MRDQEQPFDAEFRVHDTLKLHPQRIERPLPDATVMVDFAHS